MKRLTALVLAGLLVIGMLTGCTIRRMESDAPSGTGSGISDGSSEREPNTMGAFSTEDLQGNTVTQDIFAGKKLTVVHVWMTWCSYCKKDMEVLEPLRKEWEEQGVQVIGIVMDAGTPGQIDEEKKQLAQEIVSATGVSYPVLLPNENLNKARLDAVTAYPETFLVDEKGNILPLYRNGYQDKDQWQGFVEKGLALLEES